MAAAATQSLLRAAHGSVPARPAAASRAAAATAAVSRPRCAKLHGLRGSKMSSLRFRAAAGRGSGNWSEDDGVLLGTLKLPANTDLERFEMLLFQWANSLCQGANIPLQVPLKVDRVKGGARLGFARANGDGSVDVPVHIDCLVFPSDDPDSPGVPIFRAIRNGPKKGEAAPQEPGIMRSLLQALQKSVEISARV